MIFFANAIARIDASAAADVGAMMGSKNLKAVVVREKERPVAATPDSLRKFTCHLSEDAKIACFGFAPGLDMKKQKGHGSFWGCIRAVMKATNGQQGKYMCQSSIFYQYRAQRYCVMWNEVRFHATSSATNMVLIPELWIDDCAVDLMSQSGCLNGSRNRTTDVQIQEYRIHKGPLKKISLREGIAKGIVNVADAKGAEAKAFPEDYFVYNTGQAPEGYRSGGAWTGEYGIRIGKRGIGTPLRSRSQMRNRTGDVLGSCFF